VDGFLKDVRGLTRSMIERGVWSAGAAVVEVTFGEGNAVLGRTEVDCPIRHTTDQPSMDDEEGYQRFFDMYRDCWAGHCPMRCVGGKLQAGHVHVHLVVASRPFWFGRESVSMLESLTKDLASGTKTSGVPTARVLQEPCGGRSADLVPDARSVGQLRKLSRGGLELLHPEAEPEASPEVDRRSMSPIAGQAEHRLSAGGRKWVRSALADGLQDVVGASRHGPAGGLRVMVERRGWRVADFVMLDKPHGAAAYLGKVVSYVSKVTGPEAAVGQALFSRAWTQGRRTCWSFGACHGLNVAQVIDGGVEPGVGLYGSAELADLRSLEHNRTRWLRTVETVESILPIGLSNGSKSPVPMAGLVVDWWQPWAVAIRSDLWVAGVGARIVGRRLPDEQAAIDAVCDVLRHGRTTEEGRTQVPCTWKAATWYEFRRRYFSAYDPDGSLDGLEAVVSDLLRRSERGNPSTKTSAEYQDRAIQA